MIWDSISKKIMDLILKFILPVMMVRKPGIYGKIPHRDIIFQIMVSDLWNTYYVIAHPSYTIGSSILADNEADQHQQHHRHTQQYGVDSHAGYGHQQNVRQAPKQQRPGVKSPIMDDATNSGFSRRGRLFDMIQDVSR